MSQRAAPPLTAHGWADSPILAWQLRLRRDTDSARDGFDAMASPEDYHTPVLVEEVLEYLQPSSGSLYIDATVGGGGHAEQILRATAPDGRLLAIDRDPEAVEAARTRLQRLGQQDDAPIDEARWDVRLANYSDLRRLLDEIGAGRADGMVLDAGVSSHQLDDPDRGFSVDRDGPLDMRMGPDARRLDEVLEEANVETLRSWLADYGDVRGARRCARAIKEAFDDGRLASTTDLADVARDNASARRGTDPAILVFQAFRIAVNRELEHLEAAVEQFPEIVRPGGRGVFISFHSHEDRVVKHGLRELAKDCVCPPDLPVCGCDAVAKVNVLTQSPVRPSDAEVESNPRARSARLRAAEVLEFS